MAARQIKMRILDERRTEYPAEHNVGHQITEAVTGEPLQVPRSQQQLQSRNRAQVSCTIVRMGSTHDVGGTSSAHWHSTDHIFRQLLYRGRARVVHFLQPGLESLAWAMVTVYLTSQPLSGALLGRGRPFIALLRHLRRRCGDLHRIVPNLVNHPTDDARHHSLGGALRLQYRCLIRTPRSRCPDRPVIPRL